MTGIYYWVSGCGGDRDLARQAVEQLGVEPGANLSIQPADPPAGREPAGLPGPGLIVYPIPTRGLTTEPLGLYDQVWERAPGAQPGGHNWTPEGAQVAVGLLPGCPPTPEDLLRTDALQRGYLVPDSHGRRWSVPVARGPAYEQVGQLPSYRLIGQDGAATQDRILDRRWQWLWELAGEVWDWWDAQRRWQEAAQLADEAAAARDNGTAVVEATVEKLEEPDFDWLYSAAFRALGANYRLGPAAHNLLARHGDGILTDTTVAAVCHALVDWHFFEELHGNPTVPAL